MYEVLRSIDDPPGSEEGLLPGAQRPDSLTFTVYNTIRQAIVEGRLPAAARVTEAVWPSS
jgi:DNA-binding GntR family transcriptional regulator